MAAPKKHNALSISLTENTVFLRGVDFTGRRRTHDGEAPAIIRGLLTLELAKPTRISSIEVELQGKTATSLPDSGVGARRTEVIEEYKVYSATQVFYRAPTTSEAQTRRRALSVDPGLHLYRDDEPAPDYRAVSASEQQQQQQPGADRGRARVRRRQSADFSIHQSEYTRTERRPELRHAESADSSAPASALATPDRSPPLSPRFTNEPVTMFSLGNTARGYEYEARSLSRPASRTPSRAPSPSRSRVRPMMSSPGPSSYNHPPQADAPTPPSISRRVSFDEHAPPSPFLGASRSQSRSRPEPTPLPMPPPMPEHSPEIPRDRGRRSARFSLASTLLDAVKERVRSNSPIVESARGRDATKSREREREPPGLPHAHTDGLFAHLHLPGAKHSPLVHGDEDEEERKEKEFGNGWREFKKGIYTFPISFSIPPTMPPTLACFYGTVTWRLKAHVHRPGVLTAKMSAARDVVLVAAPSVDDTEDTENIVVERFWDDQMQYVLAVSGRMFAVGGAVPLDLTFLPMTKMRLHRLSVYLEERVEYYVHQARMSRADAPHRLVLLSLKHEKEHTPILPLDPSSPDVSPLASLLPPLGTPAHTEALASLMGPGPWKLHAAARIPRTAHPTNRNRRANMVVQHTLKLVMRVERGDDAALDARTGRRKLFEIVVQTPVYILSHLADTEHTALPRYSAAFDRAAAAGAAGPERPPPVPVASPDAAGAATAPVTPDTGVYDHYERLITGQESEVGEAPPAYSPAPVSAS